MKTKSYKEIWKILYKDLTKILVHFENLKSDLTEESQAKLKMIEYTLKLMETIEQENINNMSFEEYIQEKGYTEEELNILAIELEGDND